MTFISRRMAYFGKVTYSGKVSLFLEDLELGAIVISIRNLIPYLV